MLQADALDSPSRESITEMDTEADHQGHGEDKEQ